MTATRPHTLEEAARHPSAQTPMMRQYLEAKRQHPEAIVLFRMGDFYETFFEDAEVSARLLEVTLTSRNKEDEDPIPMAGIPYQALWSYVPRLLEAGHRVAICEQMEDPQQAGKLVEREVVRVITPGVVVDEQALAGTHNNFLAAVRRLEPQGPGCAVEAGVAWVDVSTGERRGARVSGLARTLDELARIEPSEILVPREDAELAELLRHQGRGAVVTPVEAEGATSADPVGDADALLERYLAETEKAGSLPLKPLERTDLEGVLRLGAETVRNLELVRTLVDGRRRGSLLGLLDRTRTAMGSRMLKQWLLYPLRSPEAVDERLDAVEALVADPMTRAQLREALEGVYDLERLVTRTVAGVASPRDLVGLAGSLRRVEPLAETLRGLDATALQRIGEALDPVAEARDRIEAALVDDPPQTLKEGGLVREGFDADLDELIAISRDGKSWFEEYAERLRHETGIGSLKVRYNHVFGYFIEVTRPNLPWVPDAWLRKQTLSNAERFYTPELKEREEKVLGAHDRRIALEAELFEELRRRVAAEGERIQATAERLARLDVLATLAELAHRQGWQRPTVHDGTELVVEAGRHPVVESLVEEGTFVPNDTTLDAEDEQILVITGPNMAGKSTVMRQVALITILAQMGGFVPASRARLGVVDQIFTRVGAADDLAQGRSTFMVEMTECASILEHATARSLVLLDEVGRGTSTYDGVAIAWAVTEHLHDVVGARTLFATHYHELTELASRRPRIANRTIAVRQRGDEIVFLRRLEPGGTNRSYGIQVARLAGLPEAVTARAGEVVEALQASSRTPGHAEEAGPDDAPGRPAEAGNAGGEASREGDDAAATEASPAGEPDPHDGRQLTLFRPTPVPSAVERRLAEVDPDDTTPRQALDLLYELKRTHGSGPAD